MSMHAEPHSVASTNGESAAHELFALSDEQILEIEPEAAAAAQSTEALVARAFRPEEVSSRDAGAGSAKEGRTPEGVSNSGPPAHGAGKVPSADAGEPPPQWLAERMADPQAGGEAR